MKLVINIPDAIKEMADEGDKRLIHLMWMIILIDAIENGIVLPKGHGDLISKDQAIEIIEFYQTNPQHFDFVNLIDEIKNEDAVIEADKEGAE